MNFSDINILDFDYPLPENRIAKFPLEKRDASKLLVLKDGRIRENRFYEISGILPAGSLLVFNETRVIQARLIFAKESGAKIEIFCLEPVAPSTDFQLAFQQKLKVRWKCLVGNSKRWKSGKLRMKISIDQKEFMLEAKRLKKSGETSIIEFRWDAAASFGDILENSGHTPIPPYLKRNSVASDKERYQTLYARNRGSVAAPTAGFHFTEEVLQQIKKRGIEQTKLSLHVGAGTFRPIVAENVTEHEMHHEKIMISKESIEKIHAHLPDQVIAVGTTSVRTLESLYWYGLYCLKKKELQQELMVRQWDPYQYQQDELLPAKEILSFLLKKMNEKGIESLQGSTQLMILPGYAYQIVQGMITNFHQPRSTLLLLVSAFIKEKWKEAYDFALGNDFRFLSYGDSCLFLPVK